MIQPSLEPAAAAMKPRQPAIRMTQRAQRRGNPLDRRCLCRRHRATGLMQGLRDENTPESLARLENVHELINAVAEFASSSPGGEPRTLSEFLQEVSLVADVDRLADDENRVTLMTLHASKGLEYPHVFIIGMEENLLPHRVSVEEDNIEEERRLAYVGITRAQQTLTMTMALKRRQFGETIQCEPSRFIAELPQDDLQWQGGTEEDEEANDERGQATLASLKSLFG